MSFEDFEKEARRILRGQDEERVANFISDCRQYELTYQIPLDEECFYKPSDDKEVIALKDALKHMKALADIDLKNQFGIYNHLWLSHAIFMAEFRIAMNESLKTGGKPSDLSYNDISRLKILRNIFHTHFPDASVKFTQATMLQQLANKLLGETISKNVCKLIDQVSAHAKSHIEKGISLDQAARMLNNPLYGQDPLKILSGNK